MRIEDFPKEKLLREDGSFFLVDHMLSELKPGDVLQPGEVVALKDSEFNRESLGMPVFVLRRSNAEEYLAHLERIRYPLVDECRNYDVRAHPTYWIVTTD